MGAGPGSNPGYLLTLEAGFDEPLNARIRDTALDPTTFDELGD
jgi:hypothetical protein